MGIFGLRIERESQEPKPKRSRYLEPAEKRRIRRMLAKGHSQQQIAEELDRDPSTISRYVDVIEAEQEEAEEKERLRNPVGHAVTKRKLEILEGMMARPEMEQRIQQAAERSVLADLGVKDESVPPPGNITEALIRLVPELPKVLGQMQQMVGQMQQVPPGFAPVQLPDGRVIVAPIQQIAELQAQQRADEQHMLTDSQAQPEPPAEAQPEPGQQEQQPVSTDPMERVNVILAYLDALIELPPDEAAADIRAKVSAGEFPEAPEWFGKEWDEIEGLINGFDALLNNPVGSFVARVSGKPMPVIPPRLLTFAKSPGGKVWWTKVRELVSAPSQAA